MGQRFTGMMAQTPMPGKTRPVPPTCVPNKEADVPMEQGGLAQGEVWPLPTKRLKPRYPFLQMQDGSLSKLYKGEGFQEQVVYY